MTTSKAFGVALLVDTTKIIVTLATSVIGGVFATLVLKASHDPSHDAATAIVLAGVSVFFALVFLFHVAERNIKGSDPWPWTYIALIAACWLPFLLSVGFAASFAFSVG